mgnify:CR=1 FL=1
MKFAPLIDPAVRKPAPKPVRVDLRKVFAIGTGLWIVALIVVLILLAVGYSVMPLVIMCVAGVIIGLLLLVWEYAASDSNATQAPSDDGSCQRS